MTGRGKLSLLLLLGLLLTGCRALVAGEQGFVTAQIALSQGQPVGQTFVADSDGLSGVQVYLSPESAAEGTIQLHLRASPGAEEDLAVSQLGVESIPAAGYINFPFPTQASSRKQYYYAFLKYRGSGQILVASGPGGSYLQGSAYSGHKPLDAQLAFRLVYDPPAALLGWAREGVLWAGILGVGLFLFVLPGWALLALVFPAWGRLAWLEKLGLAAGFGLALYPLLILWTSLIGLRLGTLYAWLPPLAGLATLAWAGVKQGRRLPAPGNPGWLRRAAGSVLGLVRSLRAVDFASLAILGLLFFTRFWSIRTLEAPMWGDSYQHTVITQLFLDHGGLFSSWQPYADLVTFTYHYGFHSAAAVFAWMTGVAAPRAVLWTGQILNFLAVIALYPLILKIGRNSWAGAAGLLVAGLLAPVPMAYVNWGRYTQLAGQVILPAALYFAWASLEGAKTDRRSASLASLAFGGLALTHLRVWIIGLAFLPALLLLCLRKEAIRAWLGQALWIGVGAGLLSLPWLLNTLSGKILAIFSKQISTPASQVSAYTQEYNQVGDLLFYLPVGLWLLLPLALAWGLWRREKGIALFATWGFIVLLITNPHWLGLPGSGSISNFTIFIAIYILAALLLGPAAGWLTGVWEGQGSTRRAWMGWNVLLALALIVLGSWGAWQRLREVRSLPYSLVGRPDVRAAAWIRSHTPDNARFLVNSFEAFGGTAIVGSDGGWWLPILTGRRTNLPPLNYAFEQGPDPDYRTRVNEFARAVAANGITHPDTLALLRESGISYLYVGQQQGQVNHSGPAVLDPQILLASPEFKPVFHQDRVWIFAVRPGAP